MRKFPGHRVVSILSILFIFLAVILSVIGIASLGQLLDFGNEPKSIILWVLSAGVLFSLSSFSLRFAARLHVRASLETLKDTRPPVLYLRSFGDDPIAARELEGPLPVVSKTEEMVLADALSQIGTCFSIAKPKEKELENPEPGWKRYLKSKLLEKPSPKVGMFRINLEDTDQSWLTGVEDMMKEAGAVVIRVGDTDGIWSEIESALKYVEPQRLLFLLPFEPDEGRSNNLGLGPISPYGYEAFRQKIERHIPCQLPPLRARRWSGLPKISFSGVLFFDSDWTPHIVPVASKGMSLSNWAPLKNTLEPFLARFKKENHL